MTQFFVEYNGKVVGSYKSITCALNLIKRKGWQNDSDNSLWLVDDNGNIYHPFLGAKLSGVI